MVFDEKKLAVESIEGLLQCRVDTVEPFTLMLAPVYVFMKLNDKLVSVKAPLDFFIPDELDRLKRYEIFFIPKFLQSASRFQTSAKIVRCLIEQSHRENILDPAPFELANEILTSVASLWGRDSRVESFFSAVFADELCGAFDPKIMLQAREQAVVRHDAGILLAGLVTFVLVHSGYNNLLVIQNIRRQVYLETVDRNEKWDYPHSEWEIIARDLKDLLTRQDYLDPACLGLITSEWARKLLSRLKRIQSIPSTKNYESLSIRSEGGFAS